MTWVISQALMDHLENSPCSQEQGEDSSLQKHSDGEQSVQLNVMPTLHPFWRNDKIMEISIFSRFGLTYAPLTVDRGEALLKLFRGGFPVRTLAVQAVVKDSMDHALDYGESFPGSFVKLDLSSSTWRTRQCSLLGGLEEFSETWPKWGSMRNGECLAREALPWAILMPEKGSGFVPTPTATDYKGGRDSELGAKKGRGAKNGHRDFCRQILGLKYPNPVATEALMGWPLGWTGLGPLETDKSADVQK